MPKVTVSLFPDKPIEVPDSEVPVLRAQGLLLEEPPAAPPQSGGKKSENKENE